MMPTIGQIDWENFAAEGPQTSARATTQKDWRNFHGRAPDSETLLGKKAFISSTKVKASSPTIDASFSFEIK